MPIETYPDQLLPTEQDARIWRFLDMKKFADLINTGELYFRRADLFADESEGLPPEEYLPILGLNPLDLRDRRDLTHSIGCMAQFREAFYVNCWHLFREETNKMWEEYGKDGVAICSRFELLRSVLNGFRDRAFLGQVRYGSRHLTGWNVLRFITTKQLKYADEREVRAFLWIMHPHADINRHFDIDNQPHVRPLTPPPNSVPPDQRRPANLQHLITEIVTAPWTSAPSLDEVSQLVARNGYEIPVRQSDLARFSTLLPGTPK
jgi:hypothetical protein